MCAILQPQVVGIHAAHPQTMQCVLCGEVAGGWFDLPNAPVCSKITQWEFSVLSNEQTTTLETKQGLW